MKLAMIGLAAALALAVGLALAQARPQTRPSTQPQIQPPVSPGGVVLIDLPLKLPAVGNVEAVRQWRFGRLESLERRSNEPDIVLRIRTADEQVHEIIGPREPLAELARQCGWLRTDTQSTAGRADYVERMIAFDADADHRLIAVISLEPFERSRARLRRAFGQRP